MDIFKITDDYKGPNIIGGKGLSLLKLIKAGFNVPQFFIITTEAYDKYLENREIDSFFGKVSETFKEYNFNIVSVRSSANIEDGSINSWAGQFETFLNVSNNELKESITNCFMSAQNLKVKTYNKNGENIKVAVIVQEMVDSEISGVAFSANPITQENEIIIEVVEGLGENIVSGKVTPDRFIIKNNEITTNNYNSTKISNEKLLEIKKNILKIEKLFKCPVDIEWAIKDEKLYILQARPITTISSDLNNLLIDLNKRKWNYTVTRDLAYYVWYMYEVTARQKEVQQKIFDVYAPASNTLLLNTDEYELDEEDDEYKEILENKLKEDENFFETLYNKQLEVSDETIKEINIIKNLDFSNMNLEDLRKEYHNFEDIYIKICVIGNIRPDDFLEEKVRNILKEHLKGEELDTSFKKMSLCPYIREIDYSQEPLELLKIAQQIKNNISEEEKEKLILNHHVKYSWIKAPIEREETSFKIEDYKSRLNNLCNIENLDEKILNIENLKHKNEEEFNSELNRFKLSKKEINLIKAMRNFIFLRTYTTALSDHLFYTARKTIFFAIANRLNISKEDIIMMSPIEIENAFLDNKIDLECIIEKRKKGYAIVTLDGKTEEFTDKKAKILQNNIAKSFKVNSSKEEDSNNIIYGTSANYGTATGVVKIVKEYSDVSKVNNGDILVATMTTPNFIEAMEKASGFITDEGGITCHAAIVSREFNLPCIVGTKNATERLKDGMKVYMDGKLGIVKIV